MMTLAKSLVIAANPNARTSKAADENKTEHENKAELVAFRNIKTLGDAISPRRRFEPNNGKVVPTDHRKGVVHRMTAKNQHCEQNHLAIERQSQQHSDPASLARRGLGVATCRQ
jgi:hypothetical protein